MAGKIIAARDKKITFLVSVIFLLIFLVLLIVYRRIPQSFDVWGFAAYIKDDNVSDYLTVLSIHFTTVFLTTGLMSTLGAKEDLIYHVDIVKLILLEPIGRSFRALSVYSFLTLFGAVVAFLLRDAYLVAFAAVAGIITVTWLFFKMIRIYFAREEEKEKQKEKLKKGQDLEHALPQLYLVIQNNMEERQMAPLVENIALLIELYQFFLKTEGQVDYEGRINDEIWGKEISYKQHEYVKDFLEKILNNVKGVQNIYLPELYARIYDYFGVEKGRGHQEAEKLLSECQSYTAKMLVDCMYDDSAGYKDELDHIMKTIYGISGELIDKYQEELKKLQSVAYTKTNVLQEKSEFVKLAENIFKAKMTKTSNIVISCSDDGPWRKVFCDEIRELVEKDERRIESENIECSKELYYFKEEEPIYCSNHILSQENGDGCFARIFPRLAVDYAGDNACKVLKDFYYTCRDRYCDPDDAKLWQYYNSFDGYFDDYPDDLIWDIRESYRYTCCYPRDGVEHTYTTMTCLFFQGCAELIMSGKGKNLIETVVDIVFDFWKMAQYYKQPEELPEFYQETFNYIGSRLLYMDDTSENENYNKHPEDVLEFVTKLIARCKKDDCPIPDRVRSFHEGVILEEFLANLKHGIPKFYSEEVVEEFERIVGGK